MFLGLKITDETLEDRLAFDEIFVEYFNAFLALPVSTQVMLYLIYHATYFYSQGSLIIQQISLHNRYTYISFLGCLNLV